MTRLVTVALVAVLVAGCASGSATTTVPGPAPCLEHDLGLEPGGPTGPVVVCGEAFAASGDFLASSVVAGDHPNAETALFVLSGGADLGPGGRNADGYVTALPEGWGGFFTVNRRGGVLTVEVSRDLAGIDGLPEKSALLLGQLFGTVFSDPTVTEATFTLGGSEQGLCDLLGEEPGCATLTREEFYAG